eukprot:1771133-Prorocentrum_lima.AAC.1
MEGDLNEQTLRRRTSDMQTGERSFFVIREKRGERREKRAESFSFFSFRSPPPSTPDLCVNERTEETSLHEWGDT